MRKRLAITPQSVVPIQQQENLDRREKAEQYRLMRYGKKIKNELKK